MKAAGTSSQQRFLEDSADQLDTSNLITEQMILSEDSSQQIVETRGLLRITSSPGPIKFDQAAAEASSFLNQGTTPR